MNDILDNSIDNSSYIIPCDIPSHFIGLYLI